MSNLILPGRIGADKLLRTSGGKIGLCPEESSSSSSSSSESSSYSLGKGCDLCPGIHPNYPTSKYIRITFSGVLYHMDKKCRCDSQGSSYLDWHGGYNGTYILTQTTWNPCWWSYTGLFYLTHITYSGTCSGTTVDNSGNVSFSKILAV